VRNRLRLTGLAGLGREDESKEIESSSLPPVNPVNPVYFFRISI
jgi:hypothetical protein